MIVDLHIHSKYSGDSIIEPITILKIAKKKRLNGIAITDHLTIKGGIEALKLNKDPNFLVIVGSEIETNNKADIIGLFLSEDIRSRRAIEIIEEIRDQGGIAFWAHPFRAGKNLLRPDLIERMDLIEGFNSKTSASRNKLAQQLAYQYSKPLIGTSDAHHASEIGNGKTLVHTTDISAVKGVLAQGKTEIVDSRLSYDYLYDVSL
ncbi:MAG: PHP domain-containing protein [Halobacteriota archaeon]